MAMARRYRADLPDRPAAVDGDAIAEFVLFANATADRGILGSVTASPLSPDDIRDQTTRLHALARRLAVASADADDAVQQTWLQSLRAGLPPARALPAFLATTFRNVLAFGGRTERRRAARELRAGTDRPLEVESTADLVATVELHRLLAALVLELPTMQRELVLRHYFAGDPIDELATRHAITAAAVRGHLHRARQELRRRLDASDGEARRAFGLLVAAASRPALPLVLTLVAMNTKSLVAVAAVVAVGLLTWRTLAPGDVAPIAPSDAGRAVAATADLDRTAAPVQRTAPTDRTEVATAHDATWVVRGEVMHGSVAPLPNGSFTAKVFAGREAKGDPLLERTVVADAKGAFELALPPVHDVVTLQFTRSRADTSIMASPRTFLPGDEPPQDLLVFAFVRDCRVTGTVTDEAGRPIDGAWVKVGRDDEPVRCAPDGSFRIEVSATYGEVSLVAGAPGHAPGKHGVKVKDRAAGAEAEFRLKPAVRLVGRVVASDGVPVPDAEVHTAETWSCPVHTDVDGRFEMLLDPVRDAHTAYVEHGDFLAEQRQFTATQLAEPCEIVLHRGASVRGRVVDRDGRPVAGAQIRLGQWIGYLAAPRGLSANDGTFEIRNVSAGRVEVATFARGFAPTRRAVDVPAGERAAAEVVVSLEPGHEIAGRVVDRDGRGIHRVRVTPIAHGPSGRWQPADEVHTTRDGAFRFVDLPAGGVTLDCFGMDVARKEEPNVGAGRRDVVIVMERPGRLAGRVVDDATGAPVPRFSVRFVDPELQPGERRVSGYGVEWLRGLTFTDADGVWRTESERFDVGAVLGVEVTADGCAPAVLRRVIASADPDPNAFVLRLQRATRIAGKVVDARTGAPIGDARIAVFDDAHPLLGRDPFADPRTASHTAADGSFAIDGASVGEVRLVVRHPDWPVAFDGPFATAAGTATSRTIALREGSTIRGTAVDANGNPVVDATIALADEVANGMRILGVSTRTDRNGRFELPRLLGMQYLVYGSGRASDGTFAVWARHVDVAADRVEEVELVPAGEGAIEVEIAADGVRTEGVFVRIARSHASMFEHPPFHANASGGTFVVRGLPAGDFDVSVAGTEPSPGWNGRASVTVGGKQPVRVRVPVAVQPR